MVEAIRDQWLIAVAIVTVGALIVWLMWSTVRIVHDTASRRSWSEGTVEASR